MTRVHWSAGIAILGAALALVPAGGAHAGGFQIGWSGLGGGATRMAGGSWSLAGGIGGGSAPLAGPGWTVVVGFWPGATGAPARTCPGDLDGTSIVDGGDLGLLLGAWGTSDPLADLDGSGVVDGADLGLLLGAWGGCG